MSQFNDQKPTQTEAVDNTTKKRKPEMWQSREYIEKAKFVLNEFGVDALGIWIMEQLKQYYK